ncbi:MAG: RecX family transcriptional regulator [Sneathiella sp.]
MDDEQEPKPKKPRKPVEPTPKWLRDQALRYLNRFPATRRKMTRHLFDKAMRHAEHFELSEDILKERITGEIEKLEAAGFINDREFAASKARVMARQGRSTAQIGVKLQEMGFSEFDQANALAGLGSDMASLDRKAAARFVKRRKFGPYKPQAIREARRNRELASLARQGFSFDVATAVIDAEDTEEIEAIIYGDAGLR